MLHQPTDRTGLKVPDLVGGNRGDFAPQDIDGDYPARYVPRADNVLHPANPLRSTDAAMPASTFRAWYWKTYVDMLRAAGFRKVKNMTGGILRWSDEVDPSIPKY